MYCVYFVKLSNLDHFIKLPLYIIYYIFFNYCKRISQKYIAKKKKNHCFKIIEENNLFVELVSTRDKFQLKLIRNLVKFEDTSSTK